MPSFVQTLNPTPFAFFDAEVGFQAEADAMVTFVKRKLGDDILSVELTSKQIWSCLEEATLEYNRHINEMRTKSELSNVLGLPTGSTDLTNRYPRQTLEFMNRLAEPYAAAAFVGGSYDSTMCYFDLEHGKQDYNIYTEMKVANGPMSGSLFVDTVPTGSRGKIRLIDVFHFEPVAAQQTLLNASNITNFLATNFNYESYVNSTIFYVLPIFEDVLRRGMLDAAFRVRRSNYSYEILGTNLRIFPTPILPNQNAVLFVNVGVRQNPLLVGGTASSGSIAFQDDTLNGISGPNDIPLGVIPYDSITSTGQQWIRQYCFALCKELLGLIRSKFDSVPVPNAEVRLNGEALVTQGREDKEKLIEQLKTFLEALTLDKLAEMDALKAENLMKQLKMTPFPRGKSIIIG